MNERELKQRVVDLYVGFEDGEFIEALEATRRLDEMDELKGLIIRGYRPVHFPDDSYSIVHLKGLLSRKDYITFNNHLKVYVDSILNYE